jgi:type III secretory pathway component EscU
MWQDTVIALCQLAFLPSMLPTLMGKDKPALTTCILNACIVSVIVICFVTLELWFSVITGMLTASIWATLAVQKWRIDSKKKIIKDEI